MFSYTPRWASLFFQIGKANSEEGLGFWVKTNSQTVALSLIQLGTTSVQLCLLLLLPIMLQELCNVGYVQDMCFSCDVSILISGIRERKEMAVGFHCQLLEIASILSSQWKLFILQLFYKL